MAHMERTPFVFNNNITTIGVMKLADGRTFFDASELWIMNGSPKTYSIDAYIESDQTKELMLYCYLKHQKLDSIRKLIKQIRREMNGNPKQLESISDYLDVSLMSEGTPAYSLTADDVRALFLPKSSDGYVSKIERHFVRDAKTDDNACVFVDQTLFLDYSMRLSIQLKSQVINVYQKYGWLEGLTRADRVEALFDLIELERAKA